MPPRQQDRSQTKGATSRRRRNGSDGQEARWADADPLVIQAMIAAVTAQGGAVTFGLTRTGDTYVLGFLGDGERYSDYIPPSEGIDAALAEIARLWNGEVPV